MYYVMQVAAGTEDKVEEQIKVMIGNELYDSCFHPMRRMKKKYRGASEKGEKEASKRKHRI